MERLCSVAHSGLSSDPGDKGAHSFGSAVPWRRLEESVVGDWRDEDDDALEFTVALREMSNEERRALIRSLTDRALTQAFTLLSDEREVVNVPSLPDVLAEIIRRDLPIGRTH